MDSLQNGKQRLLRNMFLKVEAAVRQVPAKNPVSVGVSESRDI
jgi:hypothetical protein